jgi:dTDP-4-dehydrorhamnose 3,5-epimerase-like enzyme
MIVDERGEICEIYNPAWGILDTPLVYVYQAIKGRVYHKEQDDRLFVVLYDMRDGSPTEGQIQEVTGIRTNSGSRQTRA